MFLVLTILMASVFAFSVHFRLTRHLVKKRIPRVVLFFVALLIGFSFVFAMRGRQYLQPVDGAYDVVTFGFYAMAVAGLLLVFLMARDLFLLVFSAVSKIRQKKSSAPENEQAADAADGETPASPLSSRRDFIKKISAGAVLATTAACAGPAVYAAKCGRVVRQTTMEFKQLNPAHDGLKIVHLSDIHVGNTITRNDIRDMVDETNALMPDIIVITGDIADGIPKYVAEDLEPMRDFKSKYGVFYVTGNHEHMWGGREWIEAVKQLGITVLINEHSILNINGVPLAIAGAIDRRGDRRDRSLRCRPAEALANIPQEMFKIMLVHQPATVDASFSHGADLVLLGHTHGGQFWPACYLVDAIHKYARGLYREVKDGRERMAYVSCGTGYWGPPLRLGVPPEICVHTLRHAKTA